MNRLFGLDALRGIAAIMVAAHHLEQTYGLGALPFSPLLCVELFFILSGFVMARTYEQKMRDGMSTAEFVGNRYSRLILPLAIGSLLGLVWAVAVYGIQPKVIASLLPILLFLPAPWLSNVFLLNGPAWSLFAEMTCNACHPRLIAARSARQLLVVTVALGSLHIGGTTTGIVGWGPDFLSILTLLPGALGCYLLGVVLYRIYGDKPLGRSPLLAVCGFPLVLVLLAVSLPPVIGEAIFLVLLVPLVIRASLGLPNLRWAAYIGALSYPLYAVHQPIMRLGYAVHADPVLIAGVAAVAAALVAALPNGGRIAFPGARRRSAGPELAA